MHDTREPGDMHSRSRPGRQPFPGPAAIRHLCSSTSIYRRVVLDAESLIREAIPSLPPAREEAYAELLLSLTASAAALEAVQESCAMLLGEKRWDGPGALFAGCRDHCVLTYYINGEKYCLGCGGSC